MLACAKFFTGGRPRGEVGDGANGVHWDSKIRVVNASKPMLTEGVVLDNVTHIGSDLIGVDEGISQGRTKVENLVEYSHDRGLSRDVNSSGTSSDRDILDGFVGISEWENIH